LNSIRDRGVAVTASLNFDEHITQVVQSASITCNLIFRCFIIKVPEFYINLYKSIVLPKLTYCCEVWRPYLRKHTDAIERVQTRFLRGVCRRCHLDKKSISLPPISQLYDLADMNMFKRLKLNEVVGDFFITRENNLRSGQTITAKSVARNERINNVFSWRVARRLHCRPPAL
jgi:hypothetical protein